MKKDRNDKTGLPRSSVRYSFWLSAAVAATGLAVLAGWIFDIGLLKSVLPGLVAMKANTAVGFMASGLALMLLPLCEERKRFPVVAGICSLYVTLLGLATLSQYLFGWNLGIDQLLFKEQPGAVFTTHLGRMAPPTAFNFALTGLILLLSLSGRWRIFCQASALLVGFIGLISTLGYFFGNQAIYFLPTWTQMALHTALCFVLLSTGILLYHYRLNPNTFLGADPVYRSAGLGFGLVFLILLAVGMVSIQSVTMMGDSVRGVEHTKEVIHKVDHIHEAVKTIESAQRGYAVSGQASFLQPVQSAQDEMAQLLPQLWELAKDNPSQQRRIGEFDDLAREMIKFSLDVIAVRQQKGEAAATALIALGAGSRLMDRIDAVAAGMHGEEGRLLAQRNGQVRRALTVTIVMTLFGGLFAMLAIAFSARLVAREMKARNEAEKAVHAVNEELDASNQQLNAANQELSAMNQELTNAQEELERHSDQLQAKVNEATAEIQKNYKSLKAEVEVRKLAEQKLHASEIRYRRLFETAQESILILNADTGVIEDANPFIKEMLGYPHEELIGKELWEIGALKDIITSKDNFIELKKNKYIRYDDLSMQTKDGRRMDVEFVSNIYTAAGRQVVQCNIRDITERKRAEEKITESEERYRRITEGLSDYLYTVTVRDGRAVETTHSPACQAITGYAPEEYQADPDLWINMAPAEDRDLIAERAKDILAGIKVSPLEHRIIRKDGKVRWVSDTIIQKFDDQRRLVSYDGVVHDVTQRKLLEMKLQENERKYRTLVETSPDGITLTDLEGNIVLCNRQTAYMHRYENPDMMRGIKAFDLIAPDDRPLAEQYAQQTLVKGLITNIEYTMLRSDGQRFPAELSAALIRDAEGIPSSFIAVTRDITERKRAEQMRSLSTETLEILNKPLTLEEATADILDAIKRRTDFDAVGVRLIKNEDFPYAATLGFPPDFLLAENSLAERNQEGGFCLDADGRPSLECTCGLVVTGKTDPANPLFTPCGSAWTNDSLPILDLPAGQDPRHNPRNTCIHQGYRSIALIPIRCEGQIAGLLQLNDRRPGRLTPEMISYFEGISTSFGIAIKRKQAEDQIRRQARLLDEAGDAIITKDLQHRIRYWNKSSERVFGWPQEEVLGRDVREILYPGLENRFQLDFERLLQEGVVEGEIRCRTKQGKEIEVNKRLTLIRDRSGNPESILSVNTDITEKKRLQEQYLQAQRMESLGTLAGGIAHDLNNVLAPIMLAVESLKKYVTDPGGLGMVEILEKSSARCSQILKQILGFARGTGDQLAAFQPRQVIKETVSLIQETLPRSIRVKKDIPNDLWSIRGNATQVHQVLMNLCVNARDAMPRGGNLTVTAENVVLDEEYARMHLEASPGRYLLLTVQDTGTGMSPETRARIFDPFFTTKVPGKGTGLGLSTIHSIVKTHGGFINVYSEEGKGTAFKVYFPAAEAAAGEEKPADKSMAQGNGQLVLVVDDEQAILQITSQTLEAFGYRTLTACDGAEAVALYESRGHEISLVLTDNMMPNMDGLTTIKELRKINPQAKVIISSGLSQADPAAFNEYAEANAFIAKPYTAAKLLRTIQQALEI